MERHERKPPWALVLVVIASALSTLFAGLMVSPSTATAGTYRVRACDAATGSANNSWTFRYATTSGITGALANGSNGCPTTDLADGIRCRVNNLAYVTNLGGCAIEFQAPANTRISEIIRSDMYARSGVPGCVCAASNWGGGGFFVDGPFFLGCNVGTTACSGGTGYGSSATTTFATTRTNLAIGTSCQGGPGPGASCITGNNGFGITDEAHMYSANVEVTDNALPTFTNATDADDGLTDTVYYRTGALSTTFDVDDNTGVRGTEFLLDSVSTAGPDWSACHGSATHYTYTIPCGTGAPTARVALDVTNRTYSYTPTAGQNGTHTVEFTARDSTNAAGDFNVRTMSYTVKWDNTAPAAPSAPVDGAGALNWQASGTSIATSGGTWTAGTADPLSGHGGYDLCVTTPPATTCTPSTYQAGTGTTWNPGLSLTNGQSYYFCVRARDAARDDTGAAGTGNASTSVCSDGFRVDTAQPSSFTVSDGSGSDISLVNSLTQLQANWTAATDADSGMLSAGDRYRYCVTTSSSGADCAGGAVRTWTGGIAPTPTATAITATGLSLSENTLYYMCVQARDNVLNPRVVCSNGQRTDTTVPTVTIVSPVNDIGYAAWPSFVATYNDTGASQNPGRIGFQFCSDAACATPVGGGYGAPANLTNGQNGSCSPGDGNCTALGNGSYWWRAAAIDNAGNQSAFTATRFIVIGSASESISFDTTTKNMGTASVGTDLTATTTVTVATNAANGYKLTASDPSNTWGLNQAAVDTIADWTGQVNTPSDTPAGTSPTVWAAGTSGYFGVTVRDAPGGRLAKWGTGTGWPASDYTNNKYAGLTTAANQILHTRPSYNTSSENILVTYRLNPAVGDLAGAYTTTISYTLTGIP